MFAATARWRSADGARRDPGSGDLNQSDFGGRFRDGLAIGLQALDVKFDGFLDVLLDIGPCAAGRNASREIGDIGRPVMWRLFVDHCVLLQIKPACLSIARSVPFGNSCESVPGTVTL